MNKYAALQNPMLKEGARSIASLLRGLPRSIFTRGKGGANKDMLSTVLSAFGGAVAYDVAGGLINKKKPIEIKLSDGRKFDFAGGVIKGIADDDGSGIGFYDDIMNPSGRAGITAPPTFNLSGPGPGIEIPGSKNEMLPAYNRVHIGGPSLGVFKSIPVASVRTEAPKQDVPKQDAQKTEAPKQDAQKTEAPKQDVPKQDAQKTEAPKQDVPKQDAQKTDVPIDKQDQKPQDGWNLSNTENIMLGTAAIGGGALAAYLLSRRSKKKHRH